MRLTSAYRLTLFAGTLVGMQAQQSVSQTEGLKLDHISLEQGLSQSTVNAVVQDGQGFMWFGTQDGLNRYDGYNITIRKHNALDSNSISDNTIWSLCRDKTGDLWIGTMRGGLNRYRVERDNFVCYRNDPANPHSLSDNNVTSVFLDSRGQLWCGTMNSGLNRYDAETNRFIHYRHEPGNPASLSDQTVWAVCEDSKNRIWVATWGGVAMLKPGASSFVHFKHDPRKGNSISSNNVRAMYVDRKGTLWVGTWGGGLNRYDETLNGFHRYRASPKKPAALSSDLILSIHEDNKGNLWVGTGDAGLNRYNPDNNSFTRFQHDPDNAFSLSNDIICSIYEDRVGSLWIGTGAGGVNRYDRIRNRFKHFRDNHNNPTDLNGNDVWCFAEDVDGSLWIGTYGNGLNRYGRNRNQFFHYTHDPKNPHSISHDKILSLYATKDGDVWIGTEGGGLNRYDRASGRFISFHNDPKDPRSLIQDEVNAIRELQNGELWIGTNGAGVDRFDRRTNTFVHYRTGGDSPKSIAGTAVMVIYEDRRNELWIGTWDGGVNRYDRTKDAFIHYQHNPENPNGLNNNTVLSLCEDENGTLWMGTYGGGLNGFDRTTSTFTDFTEADGLSNNVVYGILSDERGNLWLSTNKGLSRFNLRTKTFKNYDVNEGLQGNEFNQGAYFRSRTGEMFFGGINGFNEFFPDSISDNPYVPSIVLTSFRVFDQPLVSDRSITTIKDIQLSHAQNFFSFEFAALNFSSPEKNRYAYKLEGLDARWIVAGTRRYGSYTNLDPDSYVLRIKGSNNDGVWNEAGVTLGITITPPYWRTWWFRILAACAIGGLLFALYRFRVNKLLEIERLRSSIATDLHDDIGSTLTEIALYSDVSLRELRSKQVERKVNGDMSKVESLLEDIGTTSRGLIDAMNDIVWAVDPKNDSFEFLLLRMKTHAARMFDAKGINYEIDIPEELSALHLPLGFRRRFYLIFKEAVNNIMRHAHPTKVLLKIRREGRSLVMTIVDDGKGFDVELANEGNGLSNMQKRAESLNGSLAIESAPDKGTTVRLRAGIP
jgi:ligand-binding sensor domain-containing protein/signal transduction histidine kinase